MKQQIKKYSDQYTWDFIESDTEYEKSFTHILGGEKEKPGILYHKKTPNMASQNYETKIFKTNKKKT